MFVFQVPFKDRFPEVKLLGQREFFMVNLFHKMVSFFSHLLIVIIRKKSAFPHHAVHVIFTLSVGYRKKIICFISLAFLYNEVKHWKNRFKE